MAGAIKTYTNLKLQSSGYQNPQNGTLGPQSLSAGTVYYSSFVPCRGARQVVFRVRGAAANLGAGGVNMANEVTGTAAIGGGGSTGVTVVNPGTNTIAGNGVSIIARPTLGDVFAHDFCQGVVTAGAGGNTNVIVDADVYYDGDAEILCAVHGQGLLTVPA